MHQIPIDSTKYSRHMIFNYMVLLTFTLAEITSAVC